MDSQEEYLIAKSIVKCEQTEEQWGKICRGEVPWQNEQWKQYMNYTIAELKDLMKEYKATEGRSTAPTNAAVGTTMPAENATRKRFNPTGQYEMFFKAKQSRTCFGSDSVDASNSGGGGGAHADPPEIAFQNYTAMGALLAQSSQVNKISTRIKEFYLSEWKYKLHDSYEGRTFFAISGPSGVGKTQIAFNLSARKEFNVLHLALSLSEGLEEEIGVAKKQPVYMHKEISIPTVAMVQALMLDREENARGVSTDTLLHDTYLKLETIRVLSRAFDLTVNGEEEPIADARTLRDTLWNKIGQPDFAFPVVVVDEACNPEDEESRKRMLYLRTILRACGIASIFMGTSIEMVNMISTKVTHMSRGSGTMRPWASFFSLLPSAHLSSTEHLYISTASSALPTAPPLSPHAAFVVRLANLVAASTSTANSVNPYVMHTLYGIHLANPQASIDNLRAATANTIYEDNAQLRTAQGLRGQIQFALGDKLRASDRDLIHSHFARFEADQELRIARTGVFDAQQQRWSPVPAFPSSQVDPLLPLVLGGCCTGAGRDQRPFALNPLSAATKVRYPIPLTAASALMLVHAQSLEPSSKTWVGISRFYEPLLRGDPLESIMSIAAMCASQAQGVSGLPAQNFLLHFAAELQLVAPNQPLQWDNPGAIDGLWSGGNTINPFFPFISSTAFPARVLPGIGRYRRPSKIEQIDGLVTDADGNPVLAAGAKNHTHKLDANKMRPIVTKFTNKNVALGVLVVSHLAEMRAEICTNEVNVILVRVHQAAGTVSLHAIGEIAEPLPVRNKALFVFECNEVELQAKIESGAILEIQEARLAMKEG